MVKSANRELAFRTNAGIKDIIGRGLILDDNIAIIELIKNSKDAASPIVKVHFKDKTKLEPSELTLKDFGHGMNIDDIRNKWLNIAYSEKKSENAKRDKPFAGSKGVGRFSCDRLGEELTLYTKSSSGDFIKLPIDWRLFEINSVDAEISTIKLEYEILSKDDFLDEIDEVDFKTGTILKIRELRAFWGDMQIQKLKSELEKFISDPDSTFEVILKINDEPEGVISNSVFEDLSFRTYNIVSSIDAEGKFITTELRHHGEVVYDYIVANPYMHLKNIKLDVHFLNFTSKLFFKRRTGYSANSYGSIFMFLNGFRISPFGNPKNDWLGLDQRKTQGTSRYLGTRDIIGKVSVIDQEDLFTPISSREGVVQNAPYRELTAYDADQKVELRNGKYDYGFIPHIVRQLERFIVEGLKWQSVIDLSKPSRTNIPTKSIKEDPTNFALQPVDESVLKEVIEKTLRTSNFDIETFNINAKLISQLSQEADDAYNEYVLSFIENTTDKSFEELSAGDKGNFKKIALSNMEAIKAEKKARIEAQEQRLRAEEAEENAKRERLRADEAEKREVAAKLREANEKTARKAAEEKAEKEKIAREKAQLLLKDATDENIFHQLDANKNLDHIINLHHQIVLYCSTASGDIENFKYLLLDDDEYTKEDALEYLTSIEDQISKISKFSDFAISRKYKLALDSVRGNLVKFVSDYLDDLNDKKISLRRMQLVNSLDLAIEFATDYSPLDVMVLVDNIISNSRRAGAKKIVFLPPISENGLFAISDDGPGLATTISKPEKIFQKGFTTSDEGSGRGLYHVAETLKKMNLDMVISEEPAAGWSGLSLEVVRNVN